MEVDPKTPTRIIRKRPHDTDSGETPAPKRFQQDLSPMQEAGPEDANADPVSPSPTFTIVRKKKKGPLQSQPTRKYGNNSAPKVPPQLQFEEIPMMAPTAAQDTPLPDAFGHTSLEPSEPELTPEQTQALQEEDDNQDVLDDEQLESVLAAFKEDWEADPVMTFIDMSKILDTVPGAQIKAKAPGQKSVKREWSIIDREPNRPDMDHHSENPYDFLPAIMLEKLIRYWKKESKATDKLTNEDKATLGQPMMRKMLAKVVSIGKMEEDKMHTWIRAAVLSVVAQ